MPTDFKRGDDPSLKAMSAGYLMTAVNSSQGLRVVIIDACRPNSLPSRQKGFTEANQGKAFYTGLKGLGEMIFEDYETNRKKRIK